MAAVTPTQIVLDDIMGRTHHLTPGVLDVAARRAFVFGHCAELALALHERTGWPLRVVIEGSVGGYVPFDDEDEISRSTALSLSDNPDMLAAASEGKALPQHYMQRLWAHVLVERPDGLLVDVFGPRDADTVIAQYETCDDGCRFVDEGLERHRIVESDATTVACLTGNVTQVPGCADSFVDAVLALAVQPSVPWPWRWSAAAILEEAEDLAGAGVDVADDWTGLDELACNDLLVEALRRGLVPTVLHEAAGKVIARQREMVGTR